MRTPQVDDDVGLDVELSSQSGSESDWSDQSIDEQVDLHDVIEF